LTKCDVAPVQLTNYDAEETSPSLPTISLNSQGWALDNVYPYDPFGPDAYTFEDMPGFSLVLGYTDAQATCSFQTYGMYAPPPCGNNAVVPVPFWLSTWVWNTDATSDGASGAWLPVEYPGFTTLNTGSYTTQIPSWTQVYSGGTGPW
jgi:hypothetical protein